MLISVEEDLACGKGKETSFYFLGKCEVYERLRFKAFQATILLRIELRILA